MARIDIGPTTGLLPGQRVRGAALAAVLLAGAAATAQEVDPQALADTLTGDAAGSAEANPQCRLFSPEDIAGFLGEPVGPGENAGLGMGCIWYTEGYAATAMVTVVPADYAERPWGVAGFTEVPDLGTDGYAVPEFSGWAAGVVVGDDFVKVSLDRTGVEAATTIDFLRETLARRGG